MIDIATLQARIVALEARVSSLEGGQASLPGTRSASTSGPKTDTFPADMLGRPWADKVAKRDPPKWAGQSQVGVLYSGIEPDWHTSNAGFLDWKAAKGAAELPVKVDGKGKPWHERDTFEAKLCRTWAINNKDRVSAAPATPAKTDYGYGEAPDYDGEIPF